jgi:predicted amidohydrolase
MTRVASVQLEVPTDEPKEVRVERVAGIVEEQRAADLILLPEIWNVGYFNFGSYAEEAEELEGPTIERMREAARAANSWLLAGSFVERVGERLHNTSVLIDRGGELAATYRKVHLFGYGSEERRLLTRGDAVTVVDTELGRLGLATCYDLRFPELFRAMVSRDAEAFLVTSAWPYPRVEAWTTLNRARAIENQAWLISANCAAGTPPCCGRNMVVDPWGTVIAAGGDRPGVVTADIELSAAAQGARDDFPALRDRVIEPGSFG